MSVDLRSRECRPCASRGRAKVPATRIMPSGMGKCEACYKGGVDVLAPIGADHPETHHPADLTAADTGRVYTLRKPPQLPAGAQLLHSRRLGDATSPGEKMPPRKENPNWLAMQNDRSGGMDVDAIAEKHGVNRSSVYNHTKGIPGQRRRRSAPATAAKPRPAANRGSADTPELAGAIAALKARRDKLDAAIAVLEGLD